MLENELFRFLKTTTDAAFSVNEQVRYSPGMRLPERLLGYPPFGGSWQGLLPVLVDVVPLERKCVMKVAAF